MSNRGYGFEHFVEGYFLRLTEQKITDLIFDHTGKIQRTFRIPSSGAIKALDGDVVTQLFWLTKQFLIECKHWRERTKDGLVFRVPLRDLNKNIVEAKRNDKIPLFMVSYKGAVSNRIQVIVDKETFLLFNSFPCFKSALKIGFDKDKYKLGKTLILKKKYLDEVYNKQKNYVIFINDEWYVLSWDYFDSEMKELLKLHKEKNA